MTDSKNHTIHTFSCPNSFNFMINEAKELAKTEGKSFSKLVISNLAEYVQIHKHGNPQTRVTTWVLDPNTKAYPVVGQNKQIYLDYAQKQKREELLQLETRLEMYLWAVRQYL